MKPTRFTGPNSRDVMQQVRAALGADALILANRCTPEGVEILAMSESDVDGLVAGAGVPVPSQVVVETASQPFPSRSVAPARMPSAATMTADKPLSRIAAQIAAQHSAISQPRSFTDYVRGDAAVNAAAGPKQAAARRAEGPFPLILPKSESPAPGRSAPDVLAELKEMKGLLTQQFESLAWNESLRKRPLRGVLLRELLGAGFGAALSRGITERLPDDYSETQSRQWLLDELSRNISCQASPDIVDQGGVYALVGPTGAGKTTTAAKLAARCVMKHGAQGLGLITTDNYRIGAQDQLRIYGKILGVPVFIAQDTAELEHAISAYAGKHLVLIDTIGMGQRDSRIAEQHALLSLPSVKRLLLLNATCQKETLDDVIRAYSGARGVSTLHGAILTKIDEAMKLGGVLDVVLRNKLRLHFMSNGQRVPEDLHQANSKLLAHRALKAAESGSQIDGMELGIAMEMAGQTNG